MFKAGRWRSDKNRNKITAVFELQFKVTQVSENGWELMMVTIHPADAGKGTRRSEKAPVIDGECTWKPIYETVKLTNDPKTGKHGDRVYEFIVSATGRSKYEQLGEIVINFADCTQLFKPASGYFSKASSSGAILHMTLQRIRGDGEGSNADDGHGDVSVRRNRVTLQTQLSDCDGKGRAVSNGADDMNSVEGNLFDRRYGKPEDENVITSNSEETSSELQKEYHGEKNAMNANSNSSRISEGYLLQARTEDKTCKYCTSDSNRELITRNHEAIADKQEEHLASSTCKKIDEVLSEMVFLKERNQSMEAELKDMQERYSDISLKFAEVEGERQQLVMTIRTLRNANKSSFW